MSSNEKYFSSGLRQNVFYFAIRSQNRTNGKKFIKAKHNQEHGLGDLICYMTNIGCAGNTPNRTRLDFWSPNPKK